MTDRTIADIERVKVVGIVPVDSPDFDKAGKVHDWRNHVPYWARDLWPDLTHRERVLLALVAEGGASREEWD